MKCPRCERDMVKRQNKRTGQWFYGCLNFPNCERTVSLNGNDRASRQQYGRDCTTPGWDADDGLVNLGGFLGAYYGAD
jgi:ssDNA-binding Zn-finger/Zn-ribbon topoisomerase 1